MDQKAYNRLLLKRIESSFDVALLIGAVVILTSAVILYFSTVPLRFTVVNGAIGLMLIVTYVKRSRLSIETKILFGLIVPIITGLHSFLDAGFNSSAMVLILLSTSVAALYLSRKTSMTLSVVCVMLFAMLWWYSAVYDGIPIEKPTSVIWIMKLLMMVFFIVIQQLAVYTMRNYLTENIVQLEEAVDMTYQLAYTDALTGVLNKNGLLDFLSEKGTQQDIKGCLSLISVKNLNVINATFSVSTGDQLLKNYADYFQKTAKKGEAIARVGGNEFALYLKEENQDALKDRLNRMRADFNRSILTAELHNRLEYYVSYSWLDGQSIEDCYQQATLAMTYAKYNQVSSAVTYDQAFEEQLRNEEQLKSHLKEAVSQDQFYMSYQAKVDMETEKVTGVEALARLEIENFGCISPGIFVPMIEELNLSIEFGQQTFIRVLKDYKAICRKYGDDVTVSVNISPTFMISEGFDGFMAKALKEWSVAAEKIILEITEEVAINGVDMVNKILAPARARGMKISLDDFGTGYSSLSYLSTMMVDEIKIDKSFVDQMTVNRKTQLLMEAMIQLSARYGLDIVAEGVELPVQRDMLREIGCPVVQGYLYSKPEKL